MTLLLELLSWLGWALLILFALFGLGMSYLMVRGVRRRAQREQNLTPVLFTPDGFLLRIPRRQAFTPCAEWPTLAELGFRYRGRLILRDSQGERELTLFQDAAARGLLIRVEAEGGDRWWQAHMQLSTQRLVSWVSCYSMATAYWSPGEPLIHWPGADVATLCAALRREEQQALPLANELSELRRWLAGHYIRHRSERYLDEPSGAELQRMLEGERLEAFPVETLLAQYQWLAKQRLANLVLAHYIYLAEANAASWALHAQACVVVHAQMRWGELQEMLPAALSAPQGEEALGGTALLARLEGLNRQQPRGERLALLHRCDVPLPALVFAPALPDWDGVRGPAGGELPESS